LDAVERLPTPSAIVQQSSDHACTYVPIDPCQPVVAAIRLAIRERIPLAFIDRESRDFPLIQAILPDSYALKGLSLERFLAALLPVLPRPESDGLADQRIRRMAFELHRLELEFERTLFVCAVTDWPWIREAYMERQPYPQHENYFSPISTHDVNPKSLVFFLGELPFITALHERSRITLEPDDQLPIEGVKELLLAARQRWQAARDDGGDWLGPQYLQTFLQYVRNLTLLGRRLSPDMYSLVTAAKQIGGDAFARALLETARDYPVPYESNGLPPLTMSIGRANVPGLGIMHMTSRLPGPTVQWRSCELRPESERINKKRWLMLWNPFSQCSWPPEDVRIESFQQHVRDQARALMGQDLARSEKFTTSVKDGLDIRETLRHWNTGEIYVKENPPTRGGLEVVVILFDAHPNPEKYPWQTTWSAEHAEESTIGFFATNFLEDPIGPGIARAKYGGVLFVFPPRDFPDIWIDPRLPRKGPLDDRLIAAAVFHSRQPHIAVVSPKPLKSSWKTMAKRRGKRLVHLPLSRFSGRLLDRLRTVHVLNGKEIRSYAARFIVDG
jgi:hypothetical protein